MKWQRPPYILAHPGDLMGCGFHRIIRPLQIIGRNGYGGARVEPNFMDDQSLVALAPDVVVFQRQALEQQVEQIHRYRKALPKALFVFEIDDALSSVPDASWHKPFMTPHIDERLAIAVKTCDVITVTTEELKAHMEAIGPGIPVRVVPNMLGRDDLEACEQTRKAALPIPTDKLRVGWGGGIGHKGDLSILNEAMIALKDEVEWVFLGMNPDVPEGTVKAFAGMTMPDKYLASLAALNVDIIVAPLEDNHFNRCKSNLRLVEAGACLYPVIASPVSPYKTDKPPVFAYAETPGDWITSIRQFAALTRENKDMYGKSMQDWVKRIYDMDTHVEKRLAAWMPQGDRLFKPKMNRTGSGITVVCEGEIPGVPGTYKDLEAACRDLSSDILYVRQGAYVTPGMISRMSAVKADVACVFTNEGGPWGFPQVQQFTPFDPATAGTIDSIMGAQSNVIEAHAVTGPLVLIRRKVLSTIGQPDFAAFDAEIALLEWSIIAKNRGFNVGVASNIFCGVPHPNPPKRPETVEIAGRRMSLRWPQGKIDEGAFKRHREIIEIAFHKQQFKVMPPQNRQDFTGWAETADSVGPAKVEMSNDWLEGLDEAAPQVCFMKHSELLAIPDGDDLPEGWIFTLPDDAAPNPMWKALLVDAIQKNPEARIIYADHDFYHEGKRVGPDLKPRNVDIHQLLGRDYISACLAFRTNLVWPGDFTDAAHFDSELYSLALNTIGQFGRGSVAHLPRIMAHMALTNPSWKENIETRKIAAQQFCDKFGYSVKINSHEALPGFREVEYVLPGKEGVSEPSVTIIIPTKDNLDMLAPCIATVLAMTTYKNFDIVVVSNNTETPKMKAYLANLTDEKVSVVEWNHPYNWAALNNWAVAAHPGSEYVVFLNDDTRVMAPGWLTEMVAAQMQPDVAVVGAKLMYPHGAVQHIGVIAHQGLTGHMHKGMQAANPGYNGIAVLSHEATAVTGACMLMRRDTFDGFEGFDEALEHNFNDVDMCLRVLKSQLVCVVATRAELQHFEGVSRPSVQSDDGKIRMKKEADYLHSKHPEDDRYLNPNLETIAVHGGMAIAGTDLNLFRFPPHPYPWGEPGIKRVLVIGPLTTVQQEISDGAVVYRMEFQGTTCKISSPPMQNSGPWDIRIPNACMEFVRELGIDEVIITEVGETPLQVMNFAQRLAPKVIYRPHNAEAACPRGNLQIGTVSCEQGYRSNRCQACLDANSSPHGSPLIAAWVMTWLRFFNGPIEVQIDALSPEYRDALEYVYGSAKEDLSAA